MKMKKFLLMAFIGLFSINMMSAQTKAVAKTKATTVKKKAAKSNIATVPSFEYLVDAAASSAVWKGHKVTGSHAGKVTLKSGNVSVKGNKVTGGQFEMDMNSIICTDLEGEYADKFVKHLKNEDFFNSAKFPTSSFKITSATLKSDNQYTIKGDLTIKGIKHSIEFPANITVTATDVQAVANFKVDRTKYDIKYGSSSFFDKLGDKAINNDFDLELNIILKK
jgi:polyisoprenoid-binding protein YceI